jgi:deoxyribonuclease V
MLELHHEHPWNLSTAEARAVQERLRNLVETHDRLHEPAYVAGGDVGFEGHKTRTRAAVVVLELPSLELHEHAIATVATDFPYVPGLLSFREVPALLAALAKLRRLPDVILCDGQGYAHPRRFGLACHLGVLTDIPTVGVAKTRLIGRHNDVPEERGAWVPLIHQEETVGAVLRTRARVKPVYVSCGHRVGLATAIDLVMACTPRYRLPETTRWADRLASNRGKGSPG